jgi:predicted DNA-binding protein YlxM (UPF0122 family)
MTAYLHLEPVMSFQEIADEIGITRQAAYDLYRKGMIKLKARGRDRAWALLADLEQHRQYAKPGREHRAECAQ